MNATPKAKIILLVDDDPDDIYLIGEAIDECRLDARLYLAQDGEEMLDFLYHRGKYTSVEAWPRPDLILLDLNMPRKSGQEALQDIKADPVLCTIPVVILTTSKAEQDLEQSYSLGASGFVTKPVGFGSLRDAVCKIGEYWLGTVQLPEDGAQEEG